MSTIALKRVRAGLLVGLVPVFSMLGVRAGLQQSESRFDLLLALAIATLISTACVVDSRILKRPIVFIAQAALFFLWPIAVPVYLIWSRGWWGVFALAVLTAILFGVTFAAALATLISRGGFQIG